MPTPSSRTPVRIARGTLSNLNSSVDDIQEGEICYATDQDRLYVKEGGSLVSTQINLTSEIGSTIQAHDDHTAKTDVTQAFTAAQRGTVGSGTTATNSGTIEITFDFNAANNFAHTLTGLSKIMNPSNLTAGQSGAIAITNGSTAYGVSYDTAWKFEGGAPSFGTTTGAISTLVYYVVSSTHVAAKLISEPIS
tara:strand:- start:1323 stop:1901 length:579 start_codon:yes stop_codon:yes gene_type:complete